MLDQLRHESIPAPAGDQTITIVLDNINSASDIDEEGKNTLKKLISVSPNPYYTARKLVQLVDSLGEVYITVTKGVNFLQTAGSGVASGGAGYAPESGSRSRTTRRRSKSRTSRHPDHASGPESEGPRTRSRSRSISITSALSESETSASSQTGFRKIIKLRDDPYHCEVTGLPPGDVLKIHVEAAHLLPFGSSSHPNQQFLLDIFKFWWPDKQVEYLEALCSRDLIHRPSNGILLEPTIHKQFDALDFYLEPKFDERCKESEHICAFRWNGKAGAMVNWRQRNVQDTPPTHSASLEGITMMKDSCEIKLSTIDPVTAPVADPILLWVRSLVAKVYLPFRDANIAAMSNTDEGETTHAGRQEYDTEELSEDPTHHIDTDILGRKRKRSEERCPHGGTRRINGTGVDIDKWMEISVNERRIKRLKTKA